MYACGLLLFECGHVVKVHRKPVIVHLNCLQSRNVLPLRNSNLKSFSRPLLICRFVAGGKIGSFACLGCAVGFDRQANVPMRVCPLCPRGMVHNDQCMRRGGFINETQCNVKPDLPYHCSRVASVVSNSNLRNLLFTPAMDHAPLLAGVTFLSQPFQIKAARNWPICALGHQPFSFKYFTLDGSLVACGSFCPQIRCCKIE
jgi:hypothetical protein